MITRTAKLPARPTSTRLRRSVGDHFHNPVPRPSKDSGKTLRIAWNALFNKPAGTRRQPAAGASRSHVRSWMQHLIAAFTGSVIPPC
jgi:hypothetical protein